RYRTAKDPAPEQTAPTADVLKADQPVLPAWLRRRAPHRAPHGGPIAPSSAFDEDFVPVAHRGASAAARRRALERGRIVHRLMQSLPDIPPERRADAIARFLLRAAKNFSTAEQDEIARQVTAILDDQRFAEIFRPDSRPEVPIVGRLSRTGTESLG